LIGTILHQINSLKVCLVSVHSIIKLIETISNFSTNILTFERIVRLAHKQMKFPHTYRVS